MSATTIQQRQVIREDAYRGAQRDLIYRGSGVLSLVGSVTSLVLMALYPPTVAMGRARLGPRGAGGDPLDRARLSQRARSRYRPSLTSVYSSSFVGIAQIGVLQWLAGGGKAPYVQLLMLPMLGSRRPVTRSGAACRSRCSRASPRCRRCCTASIDVPGTITEFWLLSVMTLMTAVVDLEHAHASRAPRRCRRARQRARPRRPAHRDAQPPRVRRGAGAGRRELCRREALRCRCCSATSILSSRSTTPSATRPAIACCRRSHAR